MRPDDIEEKVEKLAKNESIGSKRIAHYPPAMGETEENPRSHTQMLPHGANSGYEQVIYKQYGNGATKVSRQPLACWPWPPSTHEPSLPWKGTLPNLAFTHVNRRRIKRPDQFKLFEQPFEGFLLLDRP